MRVMEQENTVTTPAAGVVVRSAWQRRILTFLMVFGPGLRTTTSTGRSSSFSLPCRCCSQPR